MLLTVDLLGTLVFAVEGAMAGIVANLDLFGLLVLAFVTALGGGLVRDVLIGDLPPACLKDWHYTATALIGGLLAFALGRRFNAIPTEMLTTLDAAGLSLFAIAGTRKALQRGLHPFVAVLLGTITGVGGGTIRDIFLARVPLVLRADVYATAALAGAIVLVGLQRVPVLAKWAALAGGLACFLLRMISVWQGWGLPRTLDQ
jgi:uncharacterized membrane protein YeiH